MKKIWMLLLILVGLSFSDVGWLGSWVDDHPDVYYAEADAQHIECVKYLGEFSQAGYPPYSDDITAIRLYVYKEEGETWDNFNYSIVLYFDVEWNGCNLITPYEGEIIVAQGIQPEDDYLNEDSVVIHLESPISTQYCTFAIGIQKHDDCCAGGFVMWRAPEPWPEWGVNSYFREIPGTGTWEREEDYINRPYYYFIQVSNDPEMLSFEPMTWAGVKSSF